MTHASPFVRLIAPVVFIGCLALAACKPSNVLRPDQSPTPSLTQKEPAAPIAKPAPRIGFPSGVWVEGDDTVWSVAVDGNRVIAKGECGLGQGLTLTGTIKNVALTYTVNTDDQTGIGKGQAVLVGDDHAYFDVSGGMQTHGLFHFNHTDLKTACSPKFTHRGPIDIRPAPNTRPGE